MGREASPFESAHLADSLRRVNRLARLMSVMQGRRGGKNRESKIQGLEEIVPPPKMDGPAGDSRG
jgi:hypothetical protein